MAEVPRSRQLLRRERTVARADAGVGSPVIGLAGEQIVVAGAGAGATPVRVATLRGGCAAPGSR